MGDSSLPTRDGPVPPRPRPGEPARFLPGAILADRYRIVAPLGHGGMGEVYRVEDLKLGQPVALKFLSASLGGDTDRRQRLLDEVRLARQVAHPNVCRVWDVGEVDGHDFLAMEYVDGEDLASLLRRIGRLPEDRAVRMARELCAGLAAAHGEGILHRDLKPANVMVDGRGRVKLADFGLAAVAEKLEDTDVRSGTPAYMSPEQLAGREVTVRSDVYALGLVLYEIFTGRVAFPARTLAEAADRTDTTPSRPSSHVEHLDPAIERAIQRCLEPDPVLRPASATAVAASLPGGDPLAAALAAGETPSPELVAAAGGAGGLRLPVALGVVAAIVVGMAGSAWIADRATPYLAELGKPPEVLAHEAREILRDNGADPEPADRAEGFVVNQLADGSSHLLFWYRQSPRPLSGDLAFGEGMLSFRNPPSAVPGMAGVQLDAGGRLLEYVRVPGPEALVTDNSGPGLSALLARAGLVPGDLQSVGPRVAPPVFGDTHVAWRSRGGNAPVRAEAASLKGWPVWLLVRPEEGGSVEVEPPAPQQEGVFLALGILVVAGIVARRNLRLERGDRVGARRVGALGAFVALVGFGAQNVFSLVPLVIFIGVAAALFLTFAFWLTYLALEPVVRRRWPNTLASWTRLLAGRFLDPLLGRDLLLGVLVGVALGGFELTGRYFTGIETGQWAIPPNLLLGGWGAASGAVQSLSSVLPAIIALLLLALLRQLLRSTWAAALVTLALISAMFGDVSTPTGLALSLPFMGLLLWVLVRLGLLAAAAALTVHHLLAHSFMTTQLTAWYADSAVAGILGTLVLTAWGFYAAVGARSRTGWGKPGTP